MKAKILFTCDIWKSHASMKVVGVFTNQRALFYAYKNLMELDSISNDNYPDMTFKEFKKFDDEDLNNSYSYCYIESFEINHV